MLLESCAIKMSQFIQSIESEEYEMRSTIFIFINFHPLLLITKKSLHKQTLEVKRVKGSLHIFQVIVIRFDNS